MRPFGVEDLSRQVAIGQVALDPAGELAVYTRRTVVDGRDRVDLWTVSVAGGAPRRLTDGPAWDTQPRFSPDGTLIAYLSARGDDPGQLHVIARDGGEPRALAAFPHGASDLAWTPDGALVVVAEDERPADPTCDVIERVDWREDDEPTVPRRPRHLHRVELAGRAQRLTSDPWEASRPRVGHDVTIHFLADPRPDADVDPRPQVHALAPGATGTVPVAVTALAGGVVRYALEDDGAIVCLGHQRPRPLDSDPPAAFRIAPGGATTRLAPGLDHWSGSVGTQTDLHDWCTDLDDAGTVTGISRDGCVVPSRLGETGVEPLVDPAALPLVGTLAVAGGSVVATLTLGAGAVAPDLYALEAAGPRRLTRHGGEWLEAYALPDVDVVEIGAIRTVLVHPAGAGDAPLATVLCIHGGPTDQWAVVPPLEAVLLAGAGYRVALPNIRGSTDRGAAWVAALGGAWGDVDAADCHAVLDHLVDAGLADAARLGCSGLSYGGFMVNWLIGTSDRFAAAVSENGVANQVAAWANCDHGPVYNRSAELGDPTTPAGVEALWASSPLRHVAQITTPLLMLQAADDLRCPPSDAEQLFTALRWLGRDVTLVRYPGEHHAFQGTGRFDRRADRHRRELDWFARHMPA